jgi:predicted 3-demethylubiquinone-9 3-methyltransferase (glyoxalase superfamily)
MQKITTFLWLNDQAEEAATFYCGIFKNSSVGAVTRYGAEAAKASGRPEDSVMTVAFCLDGQEFTALNGGPHFKFTEAISLVVNCETQAELDMFWEKLSTGGEKSHCGWLKDKFGLSWQIVPAMLPKILSDTNAAKSARVMQAVLQMTKLDIATLQKAAAA